MYEMYMKQDADLFRRADTALTGLWHYSDKVSGRKKEMKLDVGLVYHYYLRQEEWSDGHKAEQCKCGTEIGAHCTMLAGPHSAEKSYGLIHEVEGGFLRIQYDAGCFNGVQVTLSKYGALEVDSESWNRGPLK